MRTTYVLHDTEVRLTGRTAHKPNISTRRGTPSIGIKIEVTPVNQNDGTWKKWVTQDALYIIKEPDEHPAQPIDADDACREDERENAEFIDTIIEEIRTTRQQFNKEYNE